jgi:hypothetical protein
MSADGEPPTARVLTGDGPGNPMVGKNVKVKLKGPI